LLLPWTSSLGRIGHSICNPPPPAASFRLRLIDRHALCSRCGSVERAGRPRPRRSTRRGSSSEKWCRRGEIGKRGDLASLWAKALPGGAAAALAASLCFATTPGAGTHRTTPALRTSTHDVDCRYLPSLSSVFATPTEPEGACRPAPVSISNRQSHKYPIPKGSQGGLLVTSLDIGYWREWTLGIAIVFSRRIARLTTDPDVRPAATPRRVGAALAPGPAPPLFLPRRSIRRHHTRRGCAASARHPGAARSWRPARR